MLFRRNHEKTSKKQPSTGDAIASEITCTSSGDALEAIVPHQCSSNSIDILESEQTVSTNPINESSHSSSIDCEIISEDVKPLTKNSSSVNELAPSFPSSNEVFSSIANDDIQIYVDEVEDDDDILLIHWRQHKSKPPVQKRAPAAEASRNMNKSISSDVKKSSIRDKRNIEYIIQDTISILSSSDEEDDFVFQPTDFGAIANLVKDRNRNQTLLSQVTDKPPAGVAQSPNIKPINRDSLSSKSTLPNSPLKELTADNRSSSIGNLYQMRNVKNLEKRNANVDANATMITIELSSDEDESVSTDLSKDSEKNLSKELSPSCENDGTASKKAIAASNSLKTLCTTNADNSEEANKEIKNSLGSTTSLMGKIYCRPLDEMKIMKNPVESNSGASKFRTSFSANNFKFERQKNEHSNKNNNLRDTENLTVDSDIAIISETDSDMENESEDVQMKKKKCEEKASQDARTKIFDHSIDYPTTSNFGQFQVIRQPSPELNSNEKSYKQNDPVDDNQLNAQYVSAQTSLVSKEYSIRDSLLETENNGPNWEVINKYLVGKRSSNRTTSAFESKESFNKNSSKASDTVKKTYSNKQNTSDQTLTVSKLNESSIDKLIPEKEVSKIVQNTNFVKEIFSNLPPAGLKLKETSIDNFSYVEKDIENSRKVNDTSLDKENLSIKEPMTSVSEGSYINNLVFAEENDDRGEVLNELLNPQNSSAEVPPTSETEDFPIKNQDSIILTTTERNIDESNHLKNTNMMENLTLGENSEISVHRDMIPEKPHSDSSYLLETEHFSMNTTVEEVEIFKSGASRSRDHIILIPESAAKDVSFGDHNIMLQNEYLPISHAAKVTNINEIENNDNIRHPLTSNKDEILSSGIIKNNERKTNASEKDVISDISGSSDTCEKTQDVIENVSISENKEEFISIRDSPKAVNSSEINVFDTAPNSNSINLETQDSSMINHDEDKIISSKENLQKQDFVMAKNLNEVSHNSDKDEQKNAELGREQNAPLLQEGIEKSKLENAQNHGKEIQIQKTNLENEKEIEIEMNKCLNESASSQAIRSNEQKPKLQQTPLKQNELSFSGGNEDIEIDSQERSTLKILTNVVLEAQDNTEVESSSLNITSSQVEIFPDQPTSDQSKVEVLVLSSSETKNTEVSLDINNSSKITSENGAQSNQSGNSLNNYLDQVEQIDVISPTMFSEHNVSVKCQEKNKLVAETTTREMVLKENLNMAESLTENESPSDVKLEQIQSSSDKLETTDIFTNIHSEENAVINHSSPIPIIENDKDIETASQEKTLYVDESTYEDALIMDGSFDECEVVTLDIISSEQSEVSTTKSDNTHDINLPVSTEKLDCCNENSHVQEVEKTVENTTEENIPTEFNFDYNELPKQNIVDMEVEASVGTSIDNSSELDLTPNSRNKRGSDSHNIVGNLGKAMLLMSNTEPRRAKRNISFTSPIKMNESCPVFDTSPTASNKSVLEYTTFSSNVESDSPTKSLAFVDELIPQNSLYTTTNFYSSYVTDTRDNEVFLSIEECHSEKQQLNIDILASVASNQKPLKVDTQQKDGHFKLNVPKSPKNKHSFSKETCSSKQLTPNSLQMEVKPENNFQPDISPKTLQQKNKNSKANTRKSGKKKDWNIAVARRTRVSKNTDLEQKSPDTSKSKNDKIVKKTFEKNTTLGSKIKKTKKEEKVPEKLSEISSNICSESELIIDDFDSDDSLPLNMRIKKFPEKGEAKYNRRSKKSKNSVFNRKKKFESKEILTKKNSDKKKSTIECKEEKEPDKEKQKLLNKPEEDIVSTLPIKEAPTKRILHFKKAMLEMISQDLDENNVEKVISNEPENVKKPLYSNNGDKTDEYSTSSGINFQEAIEKTIVDDSNTIKPPSWNSVSEIVVEYEELNNTDSSSTCHETYMSLSEPYPLDKTKCSIIESQSNSMCNSDNIKENSKINEQIKIDESIEISCNRYDENIEICLNTESLSSNPIITPVNSESIQIKVTSNEMDENISIESRIGSEKENYMKDCSSVQIDPKEATESQGKYDELDNSKKLEEINPEETSNPEEIVPNLKDDSVSNLNEKPTGNLKLEENEEEMEINIIKDNAFNNEQKNDGVEENTKQALDQCDNLKNDIQRKSQNEIKDEAEVELKQEEWLKQDEMLKKVQKSLVTFKDTRKRLNKNIDEEKTEKQEEIKLDIGIISDNTNYFFKTKKKEHSIEQRFKQTLDNIESEEVENEEKILSDKKNITSKRRQKKNIDEGMTKLPSEDSKLEKLEGNVMDMTMEVTSKKQQMKNKDDFDIEGMLKQEEKLSGTNRCRISRRRRTEDKDFQKIGQISDDKKPKEVKQQEEINLDTKKNRSEKKPDKIDVSKCSGKYAKNKKAEVVLDVTKNMYSEKKPTYEANVKESLGEPDLEQTKNRKTEMASKKKNKKNENEKNITRTKLAEKHNEKGKIITTEDKTLRKGHEEIDVQEKIEQTSVDLKPEEKNMKEVISSDEKNIAPKKMLGKTSNKDKTKHISKDYTHKNGSSRRSQEQNSNAEISEDISKELKLEKIKTQGETNKDRTSKRKQEKNFNKGKTEPSSKESKSDEISFDTIEERTSKKRQKKNRIEEKLDHSSQLVVGTEELNLSKIKDIISKKTPNTKGDVKVGETIDSSNSEQMKNLEELSLEIGDDVSFKNKNNKYKNSEKNHRNLEKANIKEPKEQEERVLDITKYLDEKIEKKNTLCEHSKNTSEVPSSEELKNPETSMKRDKKNKDEDQIERSSEQLNSNEKQRKEEILEKFEGECEKTMMEKLDQTTKTPQSEETKYMVSNIKKNRASKKRQKSGDIIEEETSQTSSFKSESRENTEEIRSDNIKISECINNESKIIDREEKHTSAKNEPALVINKDDVYEEGKIENKNTMKETSNADKSSESEISSKILFGTNEKLHAPSMSIPSNEQKSSLPRNRRKSETNSKLHNENKMTTENTHLFDNIGTVGEDMIEIKTRNEKIASDALIQPIPRQSEKNKEDDKCSKITKKDNCRKKSRRTKTLYDTNCEIFQDIHSTSDQGKSTPKIEKNQKPISISGKNSNKIKETKEDDVDKKENLEIHGKEVNNAIFSHPYILLEKICIPSEKIDKKYGVKTERLKRKRSDSESSEKRSSNREKITSTSEMKKDFETHKKNEKQEKNLDELPKSVIYKDRVSAQRRTRSRKSTEIMDTTKEIGEIIPVHILEKPIPECISEASSFVSIVKLVDETVLEEKTQIQELPTVLSNEAIEESHLCTAEINSIQSNHEVSVSNDESNILQKDVQDIKFDCNPTSLNTYEVTQIDDVNPQDDHTSISKTKLSFVDSEHGCDSVVQSVAKELEIPSKLKPDNEDKIVMFEPKNDEETESLMNDDLKHDNKITSLEPCYDDKIVMLEPINDNIIESLKPLTNDREMVIEPRNNDEIESCVDEIIETLQPKNDDKIAPLERVNNDEKVIIKPNTDGKIMSLESDNNEKISILDQINEDEIELRKSINNDKELVIQPINDDEITSLDSSKDKITLTLEPINEEKKELLESINNEKIVPLEPINEDKIELLESLKNDMDMVIESRNYDEVTSIELGNNEKIVALEPINEDKIELIESINNYTDIVIEPINNEISLLGSSNNEKIVTLETISEDKIGLLESINNDKKVIVEPRDDEEIVTLESDNNEKLTNLEHKEDKEIATIESKENDETMILAPKNDDYIVTNEPRVHEEVPLKHNKDEGVEIEETEEKEQISVGVKIQEISNSENLKPEEIIETNELDENEIYTESSSFLNQNPVLEHEYSSKTANDKILLTDEKPSEDIGDVIVSNTVAMEIQISEVVLSSEGDEKRIFSDFEQITKDDDLENRQKLVEEETVVIDFSGEEPEIDVIIDNLHETNIAPYESSQSHEADKPPVISNESTPTLLEGILKEADFGKDEVADSQKNKRKYFEGKDDIEKLFVSPKKINTDCKIPKPPILYNCENEVEIQSTQSEVPMKQDIQQISPRVAQVSSEDEFSQKFDQSTPDERIPNISEPSENSEEIFEISPNEVVKDHENIANSAFIQTTDTHIKYESLVDIPGCENKYPTVEETQEVGLLDMSNKPNNRDFDLEETRTFKDDSQFAKVQALNLSIHKSEVMTSNEENCTQNLNTKDQKQNETQNINELSFSIERMLKPSPKLNQVELHHNNLLEETEHSLNTLKNQRNQIDTISESFKFPENIKGKQGGIQNEQLNKRIMNKIEKPNTTLKVEENCKVIVERVYSMDELAGNTSINPCINFCSAPILPISTEYIPFRYGVYNTVIPTTERMDARLDSSLVADNSLNIQNDIEGKNDNINISGKVIEDSVVNRFLNKSTVSEKSEIPFSEDTGNGSSFLKIKSPKSENKNSNEHIYSESFNENENKSSNGEQQPKQSLSIENLEQIDEYMVKTDVQQKFQSSDSIGSNKCLNTSTIKASEKYVTMIQRRKSDDCDLRCLNMTGTDRSNEHNGTNKVEMTGESNSPLNQMVGLNPDLINPTKTELKVALNVDIPDQSFVQTNINPLTMPYNVEFMAPKSTNPEHSKCTNEPILQTDKIESIEANYPQTEVTPLFDGNIEQQNLSDSFVDKLNSSSGSDGMERLLTTFQSALTESVANNMSSIEGSFSLFSNNSVDNMPFTQPHQVQNEVVSQVDFEEKSALPLSQPAQFTNNRLNVPQSTPLRPHETTQHNDPIFNMPDDIFNFDFNPVNQTTADGTFSNAFVNTTLTSANIQMIFDNLDLFYNFDDVGCEVTVDNTHVEDIACNSGITSEHIQEQLIDSIPTYIAEEEFDSNAPSKYFCIF